MVTTFLPTLNLRNKIVLPTLSSNSLLYHAPFKEVNEFVEDNGIMSKFPILTTSSSKQYQVHVHRQQNYFHRMRGNPWSKFLHVRDGERTTAMGPCAITSSIIALYTFNCRPSLLVAHLLRADSQDEAFKDMLLPFNHHCHDDRFFGAILQLRHLWKWLSSHKFKWRTNPTRTPDQNLSRVTGGWSPREN